MNKELLTAKEAGEYLGINERTLANWRCAGRYNLPFVKAGRLVRYRREDLERFIERRTFNPGAELGA